MDTAGRVHFDMDIALNAIARTLRWYERDTECIVDLPGACIYEEDVVLRAVCHPADVPIPVFEVKCDRDTVLLVESLVYRVFGQTHKLYFWDIVKLRRLDA